jgi:hypothetical protein
MNPNEERPEQLTRAMVRMSMYANCRTTAQASSKPSHQSPVTDVDCLLGVPLLPQLPANIVANND